MNAAGEKTKQMERKQKKTQNQTNPKSHHTANKEVSLQSVELSSFFFYSPLIFITKGFPGSKHTLSLKTNKSLWLSTSDALSDSLSLSWDPNLV